MGLLLWHTRAAFALAVSTFILVDPSVAQVLTLAYGSERI